MISDKIIWYKTFYNPMEANIVRAKLEDSGFHCFLVDEHLSILQPLYNQAIGGVKLMVFERDTPNIDLLLAEENVLDNHLDQFSTDHSESDIKVRCPECGSENVAFGQATKGRFSIWVMLISLMFSVYPFRVNKCFHCFNCGNEFK